MTEKMNGNSLDISAENLFIEGDNLEVLKLLQNRLIWSTRG